MPCARRLALALGLALGCLAPRAAGAELPPPETLRAWIQEMKESPKGPFERIRWFCRDGSVHPARPYPCESRGGGVQHGEWSARVEGLRDGGYWVGNVLADLRAGAFVGEGADLDVLKQILTERFLVRLDDGWIFRGARTYRGALQIEDEEAGARRVLEAMLADALWRTPARFFLLREAVRLLPRLADAVTAAEVRRLAVQVADRDPGFASLRVKIHNAPDADDARRVREHAAASGRPGAGDLYGKLAAAIDELYASRGATSTLRALAGSTGDEGLAATLREGARALEEADGPEARLEAGSRLLAEYRDRLMAPTSPERAHGLLEASLALEDDVYAVGNSLVARLAPTSRRQRLAWIRSAAAALYGAGLINDRHVRGLESSLVRIAAEQRLRVDDYGWELRYLARAPEWAGRWLHFTFGESVARFAALEPMAHLVPQDRLRGSPLLFYSSVIDSLVADANRLAGIEHRLFGRPAGAGLRALNPGIARGVLLASEGGHDERFRGDGIYLLPETVSDLPPVAGILTRGEGSSLSHVQLLARNLGIPNVVIGETLLPTVTRRLGAPAVLAVSPGGVVQLDEDGPSWDAVFGAAGMDEDVVIRPDLEKLDLSVRRLIPLAEVRASDSGRISGPKGANLGELRHAFGSAVPDGFVIPFGVFRALLDRPLEPGGPSVWDWMRGRYELIASLGERPAERERVVGEFLARLRDWIVSVDTPELRTDLEAMLEATFGARGGYGVFVRSDTNVEDLPGFTGAGLNLTVPNCVGSERILEAVHQVWASPFTERAYSWRQAHMEKPEYVFPAVVVQLGFAAEKSGVMVTADVDTGDPYWLSVAVNEGVGGAVDGQAAESLRVRSDGEAVLFLAQATAPRRAVLSPQGGVVKLPASGTDTVLEPGEIAQLVELARTAPRHFAALQRDGGPPIPADIEFAFRAGRLAILQLRPFVESKSARRNSYLAGLDARLGTRGSELIDLDGVPEVSSR